jgi:hypothetical protein
MEITMKIKNQRALDALAAGPQRVLAEMERVNKELYAPAIVDTIKVNASGRPGPNVVTGEYRDSIHATEVTALSMKFGTEQPQGHRLEYGFVGTDSMDRIYAQQPYPHFRPGIWYWQKRWGRGMLRAAMRGIVRRQVPQ